MKKIDFIITGIFSLFIVCPSVEAQSVDKVTIIDSMHYSNVFGEIRNYRIFLPAGYFRQPSKKYPVIYFLHGWSQRYFGDGGQGYSAFDKGDENNGDNIAHFVSAHDVIVVKPDGYNRSPGEEYYLRPYNVGDVETFRQFPLYFPELVAYIDAHYKTIADRGHRAISGLSMGGFMTFWIGGKYPDLFSAAGSFCGSAEFSAGPKDFPVEYRHIDMYKNYGGMNVRLNYGDRDFIRGYHQDMNRIWPWVMDHYESKVYEAEHSTCGLGDMFDFFLKTFKNPPAKPPKVNHTDVYPEFSVWDYHISSDRNVPGFTILENADRKGLKCSVREFLPDGPLMPFVNLSVTTPALYEKNKWYVINDIDTRTFKASQTKIRSDKSGRIQIPINGSSHEIGINNPDDKPNICIASIEIGNKGWATKREDVPISIKLLNKGLSAGKKIKAVLSASAEDTHIKKSNTEFGSIAVNEAMQSRLPFIVSIQNDSSAIAKLKLTISDENGNKWTDFFDIPVWKELPEIKELQIADGKTYTVAKGGVDSETVLLGNGNGDGIANPGESIVILIKDKGRYWRTHLVSMDKYVNPSGMNTRVSDDWTSFDHVGASAKYSIPLLSADCPQHHVVDFIAEYWLPEYPLHTTMQGVVRIEVVGNDKTAPAMSWVHISGNNVIQAKTYDASKIQYVKAKLTARDEPGKSLEVELNDDGLTGDIVKGDHIFSKKIPAKQFGIYTVVLEAMDAAGNKARQNVAGNFVLH